MQRLRRAVCLVAVQQSSVVPLSWPSTQFFLSRVLVRVSGVQSLVLSDLEASHTLQVDCTDFLLADGANARRRRRSFQTMPSRDCGTATIVAIIPDRKSVSLTNSRRTTSPGSRLCLVVQERNDLPAGKYLYKLTRYRAEECIAHHPIPEAENLGRKTSD